MDQSIRSPKNMIGWLEADMQISLNSQNEKYAVIPDACILSGMLTKWQRIVANRARWIGNADDRLALAEEARHDLEQMQFSDQIFCDTTYKFVEIDYTNEDLDQNLVRMPWEFLFSLANPSKSAEDLPCFRNIDYEESILKPVADFPQRLLIIESCPGIFQGKYSFVNERRSVEIALGVISDSESCCIESSVIETTNATLEHITEVVQEFEPDIIHLTGIDGYQGALLKGYPHLGSDGFYLHTKSGKEGLCAPTKLAKALLSGNKRPQLVVFDCHHSGIELARACVQYGALNAIGFYSTFVDEDVEQFVFDFYKALRESEWQTPFAYCKALDKIKEQLGSIMWRNPKDTKSNPTNQPALINKAPVKQLCIKDITIDIVEKEYVNYCSLHNNRSPFKHFSLQKSRPGKIELTVKIQMDVSNSPRPMTYIETIHLTDRIDMKKRISIPLLWSAAVKEEAIRTNLYIEISCPLGGGERKITKSIILLPYDEWEYSGEGQAWLPSFILPRDPAISKIVEGAQPLLPVLLDNPSASFDGYQRIQVTPNRDLLGIGHLNSIDIQVRALWSYISYQISPSYINPPPSYTVNSQRLRTPSEIIKSRRGTCIDLSLLFCACLEYVEILPVIFLLNGHAFCGYWRSLDAQKEFRRASKNSSTFATNLLTIADQSTETPWLIKSIAYDEIMYCINHGDLVPLESTLMCRRMGLGDAMGEGLVNLRSQSDFLGVIDVSISRLNQVRPLPLH